MGHKKDDFSVCLGCKIIVRLYNAPSMISKLNTNPQELLSDLFLAGELGRDHPACAVLHSMLSVDAGACAMADQDTGGGQGP